MTLETEVETKGNVEAGLSVYQINDGHLDFFVSRSKWLCAASSRA